MIITLSGKPGTGKTAIGLLLAKRLKYKFFSAGKYFRKLSKGKDIIFFNRLAEKDTSIDKKVDAKVLQISKKNNYVIEGHIASKTVKNASLKVYLKAGLFTRARRISKREKTPFLKSLIKIVSREELELRRYRKKYSFDYRKPNNYNLIINTNHRKVKEVADEILKHIKEVKK